MEDEKSFLYLQKKGSDGVLNTKIFNIRVLKMPALMQFEAKEIYKRDWPEEDGEVVYNSAESKAKGFDFEIEVGTNGRMSECQVNYRSLSSWMTKNGIIFSVYSPYISTGKSGCYLVKMSEPEIFESGDKLKPFIFIWTITIHCSEPLSTITLSI